MDLSTSSTLLPRTVHQLWLPDKPPNSILRRRMATVSVGLPHWEVRIWTPKDILAISDAFICRDIILDPSIGMQIRPLLLRYELLRLFGGAYADINFEFYRGIEEILLEDCAHIGIDANERAGNALLASPPGHPLWSHLLEHWKKCLTDPSPYQMGQRTHLRHLSMHIGLANWMAGNWDCREMISPTGHLAGWLYDARDLVIWTHSAIYLYPDNFQYHCKWNRPDCDHIYGAQQWTGSWIAETF